MNETRKLNEALKRLVDSANRGGRARTQLARTLASMSSRQLRKVDPAVFVRLGPQGMKIFAEAKGAGSDLMPITKPARKTSRSTMADWCRTHPWSMRGIAVVLCLVGGDTLERAFALRLDAGELSSRTYQGRPICKRLEKSEAGCVYFVTGFGLDLDRIGARTGLSIETIAEANPTIDFHHDLSPGMMLIVPGNVFR